MQELTVEAALTGKREHVYHAAMLDPHTAAELDLDQIHALVDELLDAHGRGSHPFPEPTLNRGLVTETNAAERRRWNDENWVAVWPKREPLTDAITPFLLEALALQPGERVLDVGCGGGKRRSPPRGRWDPRAPRSAPTSRCRSSSSRARGRDAGVDNVSFCVADGAARKRSRPRLFDVVMSQFGVMFFDEPAAAFTNIHAQLEPEGRIAFACWQTMDRNPWFIGAALAGFAPPPPQPEPGKSPTGPFALGDHERTRGILEAAGFADVRRTAHDCRKCPKTPSSTKPSSG